jgi:hypothetical protein
MEQLTHIMAVGGQSWGKGESSIEALNNWAKNFGRMHGDKVTVHLRAVTKDAYVDGMGTLHSARMEKLPDMTFNQKDFETCFEGQMILQDLIHGFEVSDAIYELKESSIEE